MLAQKHCEKVHKENRISSKSSIIIGNIDVVFGTSADTNNNKNK